MFDIMLDNNSPFIPIFKNNMKKTFKINVKIPIKKFKPEYSLILPIPLTKALVILIKTKDTKYAIIILILLIVKNIDITFMIIIDTIKLNNTYNKT